MSRPASPTALGQTPRGSPQEGIQPTRKEQIPPIADMIALKSAMKFQVAEPPYAATASAELHTHPTLPQTSTGSGPRTQTNEHGRQEREG